MSTALTASATITFRAFHHDLDPERISEIFSERPTNAHRRGDPRGRIRKLATKHKDGLWALQLYSGPIDTLAEKLDTCILRLVEMRAGIERLRKDDYFLDLSVGCFFDGTMRMEFFPVETLRQFAELGLSLTLDIYTHESDSPE